MIRALYLGSGLSQSVIDTFPEMFGRLIGCWTDVYSVADIPNGAGIAISARGEVITFGEWSNV